MNQSDECFLFVESGGERWPCASGAIIGRAGDVAPDRLRNVDTLSRQHLRVEKRGAHWFVTALRDGRNTTRMDGKPMVKGQAYPLMGLRTFQVDTFQFYLSAAVGLTTEIWQRPDEYQTQTKPKRRASEDSPGAPSSHASAIFDAAQPDRPAWSILLIPGPAALLDRGGRIEAANSPAGEMLGATAGGKAFDDFLVPADTASFVKLTDSLKPGAVSEPVPLSLSAADGRTVEIELCAARSDTALLITWRDIGARRVRERRLEEKLAIQTSRVHALARLASSAPISREEPTSAFALLANAAIANLSCQRCRFWIHDEMDPPSVFAESDRNGRHTIDLASMPQLASALDERGWAVVTASSPQLKSLQPAGFSPERPTILLVSLDRASRRLGLMSFERQSSGEWGEDDRAFAQCLAGHAVTTLAAGRST